MERNAIYKHERHGYVIVLSPELQNVIEEYKRTHLYYRVDPNRISISILNLIISTDTLRHGATKIYKDKELNKYFIIANAMVSSAIGSAAFKEVVDDIGISNIVENERANMNITFVKESDLQVKVAEVITLDDKNYIVETISLIKMGKFAVIDNNGKLPLFKPLKEDMPSFTSINALYSDEYKKEHMIKLARMISSRSTVECAGIRVLTSILMKFEKPLNNFENVKSSQYIDGKFLIVYLFNITNFTEVKLRGDFKKVPFELVKDKMERYI